MLRSKFGNLGRKSVVYAMRLWLWQQSQDWFDRRALKKYLYRNQV